MNKNKIIDIKPLGFPWKTEDPFLFCAYHKDAYPKGNENMGPATSLEGRDIGQDFNLKDGWRMYHGDSIPGFPCHPHRGFETVTIAETGFVDHADSLGGAGRFGNGDVQWMTAGKGMQHSEMFPLINELEENPLEMFQIWLNLPKVNKLVDPHYSMLWDEEISVINEKDMNGKSISIKLICGEISEVKANTKAPNSWASDPKNEVTICLIKLEKDAKWILPKASSDANRTLYFYKGSTLEIEGEVISANNYISVNADENITLQCGDADSFILMLQGKPIKETVAQYGPFVMNTQAELQQTMNEYQRTQFGGWPWDRHDQVHDRNKGRFANYGDGREEVK